MHITLNGEDHQFDGATNIAELVESLEIGGRRVAVMVNDAIVKRDRWNEVTLAEGDRVEVIHMVGGG